MAGATLEVGLENVGAVTVVTLDGPVDSATFEDFKKAIHQACAKQGSSVLLDCEKLSYMNSKGFGLLSAFHRISLSSMGQLYLCSINRKIVKTMDLLGLGQTLKMFPSREEALAEMK